MALTLGRLAATVKLVVDAGDLDKVYAGDLDKVYSVGVAAGFRALFAIHQDPIFQSTMMQ